MVQGELAGSSHIKKAGIKKYLLVFFGIYKKMRVSGHSMWPLLADGDVMYVKKMKRHTAGDIVVAEHPFKKIKIVKRIERIESDEFILMGLDQIEGEDSSSFGAVKKNNILGKIIAKKVQE